MRRGHKQLRLHLETSDGSRGATDAHEAPLVQPVQPVAPTRMNLPPRALWPDWMEPAPTEFEYPYLPNHDIYPRGKFKDVIWLQNSEEVQVAMPLPSHAKRYSDVNATITPGDLTATVCGELVFQCSLCGKVSTDDSVYTIDQRLSPSKTKWLVFTLVKLVPYRTWEYVFAPPPGVSDVHQVRLTPEEQAQGRRLTPLIRPLPQPR